MSASMRTLLLVEDDPQLRHALGALLRTKGYVVQELGTGREALAALEASRPALLITDVNMPELDGLELIQVARKHHPDLPIIAMSVGGTLPAPLTLEAAKLLGARETFDKLLPPSVLLDLVARILA